jgi:DNA repair protein RecO (recombination protein O)
MARPLYRDTGVVLRTYKLGESDRIVVILTEHHGKVRAVARGIRRTTSKFGARLEPMSHVRLLLAEGPPEGLDHVSQAETVESLAPLVGDLDHMTTGLAMLEAVDQLTMERQPARDVYRMLVGALRTVATRSGPLVLPAFYWKMLAADGISPELEMCVRCSESGPFPAFDMVQGGVLCRTCRSGAALSPAALALMRMILGGRMNEALAELPSPVTHEVAVHATRAVEQHIERRLRTVSMFELG